MGGGGGGGGGGWGGGGGGGGWAVSRERTRVLARNGKLIYLEGQNLGWVGGGEHSEVVKVTLVAWLSTVSMDSSRAN